MPTTYLASSTATSRFLGRCDHCIRPIAVEDADEFRDIKKVTCPDCSTTGVKLERVYGTVNRMSCDGRCMGAIGNICECNCGGVNHGGRFLQTGEALASAIMAYRATTERRRVAAQRRAETRRANREAAEAQAQAEYLRVNGSWLEGLSNYSGSNYFLQSLRDQHNAGRQLSERQITAGKDARRRERAVEAQRATELAQANAGTGAIPVPVGNGITVEGLIVSTRTENTYYGRTPGTQTKILIKTDEGFKVWVTAPRSLGRVDRGQRVRLTANLTRSDNDEFFGYGNRPRNAEIVNELSGSTMDPA